MTPDRRGDRATRDRYDELAASWHEAVARLDARYRRVTVAILLAGSLAFGSVILAVGLMRHTDEEAKQTTAALCALRHDLQRRVQSSEQLLATHPQGIADIPAATIRKGIAEQKRTIGALSGLDCA